MVPVALLGSAVYLVRKIRGLQPEYVRPMCLFILLLGIATSSGKSGS